MVRKNVRQTATIQVLKALIPYSEQNLKLAFHPSQFFDDLERSSGYSRKALQQSYFRSKNRGLVVDGEAPTLTSAGRLLVQPFVAKTINGGGQLMVIFDIPEDLSVERRKFRNALQQLDFIQTQRSVWITTNDHVRTVKDLIEELKLDGCVELYEASKLN